MKISLIVPCWFLTTMDFFNIIKESTCWMIEQLTLSLHELFIVPAFKLLIQGKEKPPKIRRVATCDVRNSFITCFRNTCFYCDRRLRMSQLKTFTFNDLLSWYPNQIDTNLNFLPLVELDTKPKQNDFNAPLIVHRWRKISKTWFGIISFLLFSWLSRQLFPYGAGFLEKRRQEQKPIMSSQQARFRCSPWCFLSRVEHLVFDHF